MSHINEFYRLQEERNTQEVKITSNIQKFMTVLAFANFIFLLIVLFINFRSRHKVNKQYIKTLKNEVTLQTEKIQDQNNQLTKSLEIMESAKKQLVESEKMASLGALVAGVAHEINTPIGIGITAISSLQDEITQLGHCINDNQLSKGMSN